MTQPSTQRQSKPRQSADASPFSVGICPSCQYSTVYTQDSMIQHMDEMMLTHGRCEHCGVSMFTLTIGRGSMRTSMNVLTDTSPQDLDALWQSHPLSASDVEQIKELVDEPSTMKFLLYQ